MGTGGDFLGGKIKICNFAEWQCCRIEKIIMNRYSLKIVYMLCALMLISSSCVPRRIKNSFIGCFDGMPTGLDTLLDLSGAFVASKTDGIDTECRFLIFYNDGMVVHYGAWGSEDCCIHVQRVVCQINTSAERGQIFWEGEVFYRWGLYKIENDIITVQFVWRQSILLGYHSSIVRYRVIDRHTIEEVLFGETVRTFHFLPIENLPSSENWLKSQRWFWCDREQYRRHRRERRFR